jgi:ATP-binding cassette, subfamily B, multidrug efflux pump
LKHLASINHFFWKYKYRLFLGICFVILTNYFRILSPQLTGYVVNNVVNSIDATASKNMHVQQNDYLVQLIINQLNKHNLGGKVFWCGIILLVIACISGLFMFLMRQTIIVMSRLIEFDQKNEIFNHYQQLDIGFYKLQSTGDLMNRISEDVSKVRMYTGPAIMYFINLAAIIGFSLFFMLKANVKLTIVALAPLPILAIAIYIVNAIINKKSEKIQALLSNLTTNAQESYSGIRVIKSFVQENAMLGFFTKNSQAYKLQALSLAKTEAIYFPSMAFIIGLSTLLTIMVGALDVIHHVDGASVGTIAEFILYIQMLTFPVSAIGWTASMTQRAATSQKRINEFLLTPSKINNSPTASIPNINGNITLKNVHFTYPHTGIKALSNFNLTITQGQKIAIVGKTGSGKSTLAQLLLRTYDVQEGTIQFEGINIENININELRKSMSYVPQDVFLFSDSVYNNILFGIEDTVNEATVFNAAKQACIDTEIMQFKEGYQTMIGERGVTLSGGQKQRISIARALIKKASIVIFDDCLSAVDAKTEKEILNNLNDYLHQKTAIIITHRIFSLLHFDKIIVLDEGVIVEEGTHTTLMLQNGYYADMYKRQQQ